MIFINGVTFEKVFNIVWIVSCTAPLHRTYTIVSAERQYLLRVYTDKKIPKKFQKKIHKKKIQKKSIFFLIQIFLG
jgi:hypothetical protein